MSAYPLNLGWRFPSLAHTDDLDYADLYKRINQEDDIYIMMQCLFVCLSRKMITSSWESPVTTWTPHNHPVQLQVSFDGSRLVFHGSMSVFMVVVVTVIIKSVIISTCDYNNDWVFKDTLQVPVVEPYAGWAMLTTQVKRKQKSQKKTKKKKENKKVKRKQKSKKKTKK